jgi:hypothetical protein
MNKKFVLASLTSVPCAPGYLDLIEEWLIGLQP